MSCFQDIFGFIEIAPESFEFTVRISYFEIYMEKIRDLLCDGNDNLQIADDRERGVYVRHATELFMQSPEEVCVAPAPSPMICADPASRWPSPPGCRTPGPIHQRVPADP